MTTTETIVACPNCGAKNRIDERASVAQPVCGRCGTPLDAATAQVGKRSSATPMTVTDDSFESDVLGAGDTPVLVDAWAPWCGPCRMLAPTLDQLAAESNGRYTIAKLNVDENPTTASRYRVSSIPAMLIFRNGRLVDQLIGVQPKTVIAARLAAAAEK